VEDEPVTQATKRPEKPEFSDEELRLIDENAAFIRPYLEGNRFLYEFLTIAFVLGLVAHVIGYWLTSSVTAEPFRLVAELVYSMGGALWTGVVVIGFVQVFPDAKRRQLRRALAAIEARKRGRDTA
jgi:hypothetical protein